LEKKVTPESVVVDLYSGDGLFAMMAARLGAKHVYIIESNPITINLGSVRTFFIFKLMTYIF
jgi:tRNA G37 N-methylase Trm5